MPSIFASHIFCILLRHFPHSYVYNSNGAHVPKVFSLCQCVENHVIAVRDLMLQYVTHILMHIQAHWYFFAGTGCINKSRASSEHCLCIKARQAFHATLVTVHKVKTIEFICMYLQQLCRKQRQTKHTIVPFRGGFFFTQKVKWGFVWAPHSATSIGRELHLNYLPAFSQNEQKLPKNKTRRKVNERQNQWHWKTEYYTVSPSLDVLSPSCSLSKSR